MDQPSTKWCRILLLLQQKQPRGTVVAAPAPLAFSFVDGVQPFEDHDLVGLDQLRRILRNAAFGKAKGIDINIIYIYIDVIYIYISICNIIYIMYITYNIYYI